MLARRFTIVCLIVALFGMGLATVVADTSHARKTVPQQSVTPLLFPFGR